MNSHEAPGRTDPSSTSPSEGTTAPPSATVPLGEVARLIRSKNAGPFHLTFDIMFATHDDYLRVKHSGVLNVATFAALYRVPEHTVAFFACDNALAFKFTIPRPHTQGDIRDADLHGGQQYAPLLHLAIPPTR